MKYHKNSLKQKPFQGTQKCFREGIEYQLFLDSQLPACVVFEWY